ncbi:ATP-binding cassette domain-containing protein [Halomicroarcula sp. S1AR25-4]|uniref:ATP-binding cassette domain-containing protein n=1 Tax=Haloarcula sp. S1AR25-4 TaxID=2950538 RepID=UPI00287482CA|nr:ATP-binding cassette domain-containing protein [Halomicroarcula sp. S1AR25-4]MDS0276733.1 ATP-binding cassette domain-containing protein [Halomicroarcula sp. S1AR25-4]
MSESGTTNLIEMRGIEKHFGRVVALNGVDLEVREGEIMGLLGDNGSGKSTLIKTLVGVHQPDAGEVFIRGEQVHISNPKEARKYGISTVYQDLALVDTLSVSANMFLARNPMKRYAGISVVDWETMNEQAEEIIRSRLNLEIDPTARVEFLSGGERQAVAIARSLVTDPDLVIMDEPTSALSADSARRVRDLIQTLNDEGITVLLITHNMDEVFALTDRVTILDSGDLVGTVATDRVTKEDIVQMMVSGEMPASIQDTTGDTEAHA